MGHRLQLIQKSCNTIHPEDVHFDSGI